MDRKRKRENLRRKRLEREAQERRRERLAGLISKGIIAAAVALIAAGVVLVITGDTDKLAGADEVAEAYAGIPQEGLRLGKPDAELVITEWADLQCPACRQFATEELPDLLELVRSGEVKLEILPFPILGQDSVEAAIAALIAAGEGRYFQFIDLFYRNQGVEGTGYVTAEFLDGLLKAVGVEAAYEPTPQLSKRVERSFERAQKLGLTGTPSLIVSGPGGEEQVPEASAEAVRAALERVR